MSICSSSQEAKNNALARAYSKFVEVTPGKRISRVGSTLRLGYNNLKEKVEVNKMVIDGTSNVSNWALDTFGNKFSSDWYSIENHQSDNIIGSYYEVRLQFPANLEFAYKIKFGETDFVDKEIVKDWDAIHALTVSFYKDLEPIDNIRGIQNFAFPATSDELLSENNTQATQTLLDIANGDRSTNKDILIQIGERLATATGVKYSIISAEEAQTMLPGIYKGEKAFFHKKHVYLVGDKFDTETVFHEFSHPFIRLMAIENRVLFDNLYTQLELTNPGLIAQVQAAYPELEYGSDAFKEEVLVFAVSKSADSQFIPDDSTGFIKVIKDILYIIKQALRKVFGKRIKISSLNANTTLEDLGKILAEGQMIKLDLDKITTEDIVSFSKELDDISKDLMGDAMFNTITNEINKSLNILHTSLGKMQGISAVEPSRLDFRGRPDTLMALLSSDDMYSKSYIDKLIKLLRPNKKTEEQLLRIRDAAIKNKDNALLQEVIEAMTPDPVSGFYNLIKIKNLVYDRLSAEDKAKIDKNIEDQADLLKQFAKELKNDLEFEANRAKALTETIFQMAKVTGKMVKRLERLAEDVDDKVGLREAKLYTDQLTYWKEEWHEVKDSLVTAGVPTDSPLISKLNEIITNVEKGLKTTHSITRKGTSELLATVLQSYQDSIDEYYTNEIEDLKKKNGAPSRIKSLEDEWANRSLVKKDEKGNTVSIQSMIERTFTGELGDANPFNSFFEGYMYNQDPTIMGFAKYVKDNFTEVLAVAQKKFNDFIYELKPLLEVAGWNPRNVAELGKQVTFEDLVGTIDDKGNYSTKRVVTFLNANKDYRADLYRRNNEIRIAEEKYNTDRSAENLDNLNKLKDELNEWKSKYFYRDYIDEVYDVEAVFNKGANDVIGQEAKKRLDMYDEEIHRKSNPQDVFQEEELRQARIKKDRGFALTNENGTPKTGIELEISQRLQEYRRLTNKYYEWVERPNAFQNAYTNQLDTIEEVVDAELAKDFTLDPNSIEYKEKKKEMIKESIDKWVEQNTDVKLSDEFWEERNRLKLEMDAIADKVKQSDEYIEKHNKLQGRRNAILLRTYDNNGQTDISLLTAEEIDEVHDIDERLKQLREDLYIKPASGLSKEDADMLREYTQELLYKQKQLKKKEDQFARYKTSLYESQIKELQEDIELLNSNIKVLEEARRASISDEDRLKYVQLKTAYDNMVEYKPTEYYYEAFIDAFSAIQDDKLKKEYLRKTEMQSIDDIRNKDSVIYLDSAYIWILSRDAGFKEWFHRTHSSYERVDRDGNEQVTYDPRRLYTYMSPTKEEYYASTEIITDDGPISIPRVPSFKFKERRVKDFIINDRGERVELRIPRIVGKTIDNRGHWLPKNKEDMLAYQRKHNIPMEDAMMYINEQYYALKENNPAMFAVLEALTKHHLANQEGATASSRLYMDVPRYEKEFLETFQSRSTAENIKNNPLFILIRKIREFFINVKHAYLQGNNYAFEKEQFKLVSLDMLDEEISKLVISGTNSMESNMVSLDVMHSMMRYMLSVERQKKMIEMLPYAKGLEQSLKDVEGKNQGVNTMNKADRKDWYKKLLTGLTHLGPKYITDKSESTRSKMVKAIMDREFYGQMQAGFTKNYQGINKIASALMGRASFGYFAFNIPSAIKNNLGQQFQSMLYAVGGTQYGFKDLVFGEAFGTKLSTMISFNTRNKGELPLMLQLMEVMDPAEGRTADKFGDRFTRTLWRDFTKPGVLYNTRQWLQLQASLTIFGAHLNNKTLKQYNPDGSFKEIKYHEAWELVNGQLKLKDGINPEWSHLNTTYTYTKGDDYEKVAIKYGMTLEEMEKKISRKEFNKLKEGDTVTIGTRQKFLKFVNTQHDLQNKLNGAYAPWEQPEANRYLLFRLVSYLRKYFTRMFMNRFQFSGKIMRPLPRYNIGGDTVEMGWYIEAVRGMIKTLVNIGKKGRFTTKKERFAMLRMGIEIAALISLGFILPLVLGFNPDDDEKYDKMRERSGHLPFLFAPEDEAHPWNLPGWLQNHAILMSMQVRQENEAFLPFPGFGSDDYVNMASLKSIAFGPTIEAYTKMASSLVDTVMMDESAQYKRDMGPYEWQREGGYKPIKYLASMFGFTGSTLSPHDSMRTLMSMRARGM